MKVKIPDTIRKTNPLWVEKIEKRNTWEEVRGVCNIKDRELNIGDYSCCIVGEALNMFDKSYYAFENKNIDTEITIRPNKYYQCATCSDYSCSFNNEIINLDIYGANHLEQFEEDLENFAKHLETCHKDLIE